MWGPHSPASFSYWALQELGADAVHDWRDAAALPKLYGQQPFDVVFDVVGGECFCSRPAGGIKLSQAWTGSVW